MNSNLDDFFYKANTEIPALTYIFGLEPFSLSISEEGSLENDWTESVIGKIVNDFNKITTKITSEKKFLDIHYTNQKIINSIITHIYIQALSSARKYLSHNIGINISQITKYTTCMGYFELCSKNILCDDERFIPIAQDINSFNNQRSIKNYPVLNISKKFKDGINKKNWNDIRSQDAKLRVNVKTMCFDANKNMYDSYINSSLRWINAENNDFSIYNTDIVFTIISYYRRFDTALKTIISYINSGNIQVKELQHLTIKLCKAYISTSEKTFAKITLNDSQDAMMDKYLHNYEIEHLFHFQLLPQLLKIRRTILKYYAPIDDSLKSDLDKLLIHFTSLPNSFSRITIILNLINEYFGIELKKDEQGFLIDTEIFNKKDLSSELIQNAYDYISYLSYIYFPATEKASFYSLCETIAQPAYKYKYESTYKNKKSLFDNSSTLIEIMWLIKINFFGRYLNPNIEPGNSTSEKCNFLINPFNGYIANKSKEVLIKLNYKKNKDDNSLDVYSFDVKSLDENEIAFLTQFFCETFSSKNFKKNNDIIFGRKYLGIKTSSDVNEDEETLTKDISSTYLKYIASNSDLFK